MLEGSRLGARYLLAGMGPARDALPTAFLEHGAGQRLWSSYLARLETAAWTDTRLERAGQAAAALFEVFFDEAHRFAPNMEMSR